MVMEVNNEYDQYLVMMDGSRRTTARNRKFLCKIRADKLATGRQDRATVAQGRPAPTGPAGQRQEPAGATGTSPTNDTRVPDWATLPPEIHTPARPADQTPRRWPAGILLRDSAARRVTFGDEPEAERGNEDEVQPEELAMPAQP